MNSAGSSIWVLGEGRLQRWWPVGPIWIDKLLREVSCPMDLMPLWVSHWHCPGLSLSGPKPLHSSSSSDSKGAPRDSPHTPTTLCSSHCSRTLSHLHCLCFSTATGGPTSPRYFIKLCWGPHSEELFGLRHLLLFLM